MKPFHSLQRHSQFEAGLENAASNAFASVMEQSEASPGGPFVVEGMRIPRGEQPEIYLPLFEAVLTSRLNRTFLGSSVVLQPEMPTTSHRRSEFRPGRREALARSGAFKIFINRGAMVN